MIRPKKQGRGRRPFREKDRTRINGFIRVPEVRLINHDGTQLGVMPTRKAQQLADQAGLDLVEIAANSSPPVCKIINYGKFKYEKEKQQKQAKKNQTVVKLKEVKYHANVEEHDYQTKMRHIRDFLDAGNRIKCSLMFRGRENSHTDLGFELFNRIIEELSDIAKVDQPPKLAGRNLSMMLSPGKATPGSKS